MHQNSLNEKPLGNFLKFTNQLINMQYIKSITCENNDCEIKIANTHNGDDYCPDNIINVSENELHAEQHNMDKSFVKIKNKLINSQYIKSIRNHNSAHVVDIANTEIGAWDTQLPDDIIYISKDEYEHIYNSKPLSNFMKVSNKLINPKYIKNIEYHGDFCNIVVANTDYGICYHYDNKIKVSKDECTNNL